MMARRDLPPRLAEALLRRRLPGGVVDASIRGDLREDYRRVTERFGRVAADVWYWLVATSLAARYAVTSPVGRRAAPLARANRSDTMRTWMHDLRHAARGLRRQPVFAGVTILTLALAIGATTAMYTVVYAVLLSPLPFPDPDRLVSIRTNTGGPGWYGSSPAEFLDLRDQTRGYAAMAGFTQPTVTLGDSLEPNRVNVVFATAEFPRVIGVTPVMGRWFTEEEAQPNVPFVVVLSHGLWQSYFAGADNVLGRTVNLFGTVCTVIGVMPDGFTFPDPTFVAWLPFQFNAATAAQNRSNHFINVVARLESGASLEVARRDTESVVARAIATYPENYSERGYRVRIEALHDQIVGTARTPLVAVFAGVAFLLVIACVNITHLLITRAQHRRREVAVRAALGASRARLTWQAIAESVVLVTAGGLVGMALAFGGTRVLLAVAPDSLPRLHNVAVGLPVFSFSFGLVTAVGLILGLIPALHMARTSVRDALQDQGRGNAGGRAERMVRRVLVGGQVAFAVILGAGALLMARTAGNLARVDAGVDPDRVVLMAVNPPSAGYPNPEDAVGLYRRLLTEVEATPGVASAGAVVWPPFVGGSPLWSIAIDGQPVDDLGAASDAEAQQVTPGYFATIGMRLARGRWLEPGDVADGRPVALVNETMAATFWPGEDPIGKRFRPWSSETWMEIVGVVRNVRDKGPAVDAQARFYVPHAQAFQTAYFSAVGMWLAVQTTVEPAAAIGSIRETIRRVDAAAPVTNVNTLTDLMAATVDRQTFTLLLLTTFAGLALLLTTVGVYAVVAYSVATRQREIGLRVALGATADRVIRHIVAEGMTMAGAGIVVGLLGAAFFARALQGLTFGVSGTDPAIHAGVATTFLLAAGAASFIPAWRASRMDPGRTLGRE